MKNAFFAFLFVVSLLTTSCGGRPEADSDEYDRSIEKMTKENKEYYEQQSNLRKTTALVLIRKNRVIEKTLACLEQVDFESSNKTLFSLIPDCLPELEVGASSEIPTLEEGLSYTLFFWHLEEAEWVYGQIQEELVAEVRKSPAYRKLIAELDYVLDFFSGRYPAVLEDIFDQIADVDQRLAESAGKNDARLYQERNILIQAFPKSVNSRKILEVWGTRNRIFRYRWDDFDGRVNFLAHVRQDMTAEK